MTIQCPYHQQIKTRASEILKYDCPNNHTIPELKASGDIFLIRNTVAVAVCKARDQLAATVPDPSGPTARNPLIARGRIHRPYFNKRNFKLVINEIIREIRAG